jgi:hypothetical protein
MARDGDRFIGRPTSMSSFEIPQTVLLHPKMTLTALRLYRLVDLFTKNQEYCELVITKVSDQLGVSSRSVFDARKLLEELAFIETVGTCPRLTKLKTVESQYISKVDEELLKDQEIRLSDVQVAALESSLTRDRKCFASRKYLARFLGITVEGISRSRKRIQASAKKRTQFSNILHIGKKSALAIGKKAHSSTAPPHTPPIRKYRQIGIDKPVVFTTGQQARSLRALADLEKMEKNNNDPTADMESAFSTPEFRKKMSRVDKRQVKRPRAKPLLSKDRMVIENADSWSDTQMLQFVLALSLANGVPNWYTRVAGAVSAPAALVQLRGFRRMAEADLSPRAKLAPFLKLWFEHWESFCRVNPNAVEIGFNPNYWKTGAWSKVKSFVFPMMTAARLVEPIDKMFSIDEFFKPLDTDPKVD